MVAGEIALTVPLAPKGKGRPRMARRGKHAIVYTPTATREWEESIASYVRQWVVARRAEGMQLSLPFDVALEVDLVAVLSRPKRLRRKKDPDGLIWAPVKPDHDNIEKAVFDGLQIGAKNWEGTIPSALLKARIIADDSLVVAQPTYKLYAEKSGSPRLILRIRPVTPEAMARVLELADSIPGLDEAVARR